jgi:hypothetical protein
MTFKELVMNNEFQSLVPQLISIDERCKEALESFDYSFNLIRRMEAKPDGKIENICWSDPSYEVPFITDTNLHDGEWEECIARELIVDKEVHLFDAPLCAHCLWEITFWGFTPEQEVEHFENILNRKKNS